MHHRELGIPLQFRRAGPSDALPFATFAGRVFRESYEHLCRPQDMQAYLVAHFGPLQQEAELKHPDRLTLLAESNAEITGYAQLHLGEQPDAAIFAEEHLASIARFYVDQRWHGQGIADHLMRETITAARHLNVARLWLSVWKQNPRAVAFYQRMGFQICGEQTFVMGEDVQHDHVMTRALNLPPV